MTLSKKQRMTRTKKRMSHRKRSRITRTTKIGGSPEIIRTFFQNLQQNLISAGFGTASLVAFINSNLKKDIITDVLSKYEPTTYSGRFLKFVSTCVPVTSLSWLVKTTLSRIYAQPSNDVPIRILTHARVKQAIEASRVGLDMKSITCIDVVTYIVQYLWEYLTTQKCAAGVTEGGKPATRSKSAAQKKLDYELNQLNRENREYDRHTNDRFFNEFWGLFFFAFLVIIVLLIVIGPFMLLGWADSNTFFSVLQRILDTMFV